MTLPNTPPPSLPAFKLQWQRLSASFSQVRFADLSACQVSWKTVKDICRLPNLQHLVFSDTQHLTPAPKDGVQLPFEASTKLTSLTLPSMTDKSATWPGISCLTALRTLSVEGYSGQMPYPALSKLPRLTSLKVNQPQRCLSCLVLLRELDMQC